MQQFKNPYYSIYQRMGCAGEIYVNDVLVFKRYGESTENSGNSTGAIPINHVLLESGTYQVKGRMMPRKGNTTLTERDFISLDFHLDETENGQMIGNRVKVNPRLEQPWDGLSENINYPIYEVSTEIKVELPFVIDGWQNSIDLSKIEEKKLFKEVYAYYNKIYLILQSHDAGRFLELSRDKMRLQEQAFYFTEERKKNFEKGAMQLFQQNLDLATLNPTDVRLQILGQGKLVRLTRIDGSEALKYVSPKPEEQSDIELEIKLHIPNSKKGFRII